MAKLATVLLLASVYSAASPNSADANCPNPALDTAMASQQVPGTALSPPAAHPVLRRVVVAAGSSIFVRDMETLNAIGSELVLSGSVEGSPNPVLMGTGSGVYGAFVAQQDGVVSRINPAGTTPTLDWQADLRRTGCPDDSVSAVPAVHLRRYASSSFQARYSTDLVYVATRYDAACTNGAARNRVYALNAETGEPVWVFNEDGAQNMDASYEAPYLDYATDRLVIGTDRTFSTSQDSVWSIDLLSGGKAWSASVGQVFSSPQVREGRVYVATLFGEIKALSMHDGATLWSVSNGGIPISTNIFREFRRPFGETIASVDYDGRVWMVVDNGDFATSAWTTTLVDPVSGASTRASSRVASDSANGKLYVGAEDGQMYQLNLVDGAVEATRMVSTGSPVGGASFVFEGSDVNMVAGAANGTVAKFCAPWSAEASMTPLLPNCTSDDQCDPDDPNPTACSQWACRSGVCVALPFADGTSCPDGDGNPNTSDDQCNAGVCLGTSECQGAPGSCVCSDESGATVLRRLHVSQGTCDVAPPTDSGIDPLAFCAQEVTAVVAQSDCLAHGSGNRTAVWVHLFDQDRRPFDITTNGSMEMSMSGGAGSPPVFLSPATMNSVSGTTASLAAGTVVASSRPGTYYAYLGAQGTTAAPSGTTPWNIRVNVTLDNGGTCIDTASDGQVLSVPITMGHVATQACPLDASAGPGGSLQVRVTDGGVGQFQAPVEIASGATLLLAQSFEESMLGTPQGGTSALTDATGAAEFVDFGHALYGPVSVSATCPGGFIGDANTQVVLASTSDVEIALGCSTPTSPGHITYQVGDMFRIEATDGAVPVNLTSMLNALEPGTSNGEGYPAVSKNGEWMTLRTERTGGPCAGWACLAIVNSDFTSIEVPVVGGFRLHPEGRTAISNDGNTMVFFDDGIHAEDLYVTQRSGGSWSSPLRLTNASPHNFNNQAVLSADGSKVLFDCGPVPYGQEGTGVCEVGIDGTGFLQLVDPDVDNPVGGGTDHQARHADYAPDGSVVFEADWNAEQLWRLTSPGATPTQIIPGHSNDNSPCVLPNGTIASLWLGRPEGSGDHELTITAADGLESAVITPDVDLSDTGISCHD